MFNFISNEFDLTIHCEMIKSRNRNKWTWEMFDANRQRRIVTSCCHSLKMRRSQYRRKTRCHDQNAQMIIEPIEIEKEFLYSFSFHFQYHNWHNEYHWMWMTDDRKVPIWKEKKRILFDFFFFLTRDILYKR